MDGSCRRRFAGELQLVLLLFSRGCHLARIDPDPEVTEFLGFPHEAAFFRRRSVDNGTGLYEFARLRLADTLAQCGGPQKGGDALPPHVRALLYGGKLRRGESNTYDQGALTLLRLATDCLRRWFRLPCRRYDRQRTPGGLVKIDAMLSNYAEVSNNLLYISGGGIDMGHVPPGMAPPYAVNLALGMVVTVPWEKTNQQHTVDIVLMTEDGEEVQVPLVDGTAGPVRMQLAFNVGRPPTMSAGDDQRVALAANFPGLPLPWLGAYVFVLRIDGSDENSIRYRLVSAPGVPSFGAGGPATPGPLGRS
jgi:hypothetical protein